jgi:hypothetical protein
MSDITIGMTTLHKAAQDALARQFGVHVMTIEKVISRKPGDHLP